jgi:hypothetical protein
MIQLSRLGLLVMRFGGVKGSGLFFDVDEMFFVLCIVVDGWHVYGKPLSGSGE